MTPKRLAVIGSTGMLGSDLVRFLGKSFQVIEIHKGSYQEHIGDAFDIIINANGNSRRFWANEHPYEDFVASTESVYKTIFDFSCELYIYISSSDVYENHSSPKYTQEEQVMNPSRLSPYGFHKYLSETIIRRYVKNYLILRSSMILGRNLKKGPFFDIFHHQPLFVSKTSKFQLITTAEIAKIISFLINRLESRSIFNLGGVGTFSFEKINDYFKKPVSFQMKTEKQTYEMNVTKLQKIYNLKTSEAYLQDYLQKPI